VKLPQIFGNLTPSHAYLLNSLMFLPVGFLGFAEKHLRQAVSVELFLRPALLEAYLTFLKVRGFILLCQFFNK
jgi:hypothetical protein